VAILEQQRTERRRRWSKVLVISLAVVAVAAIAYYLLRRPLLIALATGPEYYAKFTTVGGLRGGDEVRYGGLPVGRVRSVEIDPKDPSKILVTLRVDERTPMRSDMHASIVDVTNPVTRYLNLLAGSRDAPKLPPGREVPTETGPTLEQTLTRVALLLERTDTLLDAAAPLLNGNFFAHLGRTTARLDRLTGAVERGADRWGPGLERAAVRLDTVMDHTSRLLAAVDSATPDLRAASAEALGMLQDTRAMVAELRTGAAQGGGVNELMRNLTTATEDLSRITARLERDPAAFLRGQRSVAKTAGPKLDD
jgi:phospholipid/cholesterol/gamma-HCH transport system substrate-binding protein